jgi:hypothetical protein
MRAVRALNMAGVEPAVVADGRPGFRWVSPELLIVDESYQRNLADRSISLIRRIVADWDWRRFKPPVVVETGDGLEVIDGQHTAIAAASHPSIAEIPVMLVDAAEQADRARAFIGHNRDRISVTATQLHVAAVAAGDPDAVTLQQVCERAGVRVLRVPPGNGAFKPGDTMAVAAIMALINRRGAMRARQLLEVLTKARIAPVPAAGVRAVEMLLCDPEYSGEITADDLTSVIVTMGPQAERDAKIFASAHNVPLWRALAITWFKGRPRGRKRTN